VHDGRNREQALDILQRFSATPGVPIKRGDQEKKGVNPRHSARFPNLHGDGEAGREIVANQISEDGFNREISGIDTERIKKADKCLRQL